MISHPRSHLVIVGLMRLLLEFPSTFMFLFSIFTSNCSEILVVDNNKKWHTCPTTRDYVFLVKFEFSLREGEGCLTKNIFIGSVIIRSKIEFFYQIINFCSKHFWHHWHEKERDSFGDQNIRNQEYLRTRTKTVIDGTVKSCLCNLGLHVGESLARARASWVEISDIGSLFSLVLDI